jgi:L-alanine-DL-glutamate epimerase-like enolase superfamily enzyme
MDGRLRGHEYAKSGLDVACWDAFGRITGQPVTALLGGALHDELPLYVAIPLGPPAQMAEFVARERAAGIRNFQAKLGADPADDAARVMAVLGATP